MALAQFPGPRGGGRPAQRLHGPAAGGGGAARLPAAVAGGPARASGPAVHAHGHGRWPRRCSCCRSWRHSPGRPWPTCGSEYAEQLTSLNIGRWHATRTLLWDGRLSLLTALLAGFGRAAAEVGAVMLVGGNIRGHTRTMTTTIALETSRGDLPLALGLGIVLIGLIALVNALAYGLGEVARRRAGRHSRPVVAEQRRRLHPLRNWQSGVASAISRAMPRTTCRCAWNGSASPRAGPCCFPA